MQFSEELSIARSSQEELQQLKQSYKYVTLKKSTSANSETAPFPVTAVVSFVAPASASAYDVTAFKVRTLQEHVRDVDLTDLVMHMSSLPHLQSPRI